MREFIRKLNREHGTTVILTTHDMQDIQAIAQRVILIGKGRILLDGSLEDIRRQGKPDDPAAEDSLDQAVANLYRKLEIS